MAVRTLCVLCALAAAVSCGCRSAAPMPDWVKDAGNPVPEQSGDTLRAVGFVPPGMEAQGQKQAALDQAVAELKKQVSDRTRAILRDAMAAASVKEADLGDTFAQVPASVSRRTFSMLRPIHFWTDPDTRAVYVLCELPVSAVLKATREAAAREAGHVQSFDKKQMAEAVVKSLDAKMQNQNKGSP